MFTKSGNIIFPNDKEVIPEKYFNTEKLSSNCLKCKKPTLHRKFYLHKAPEILILHIKRFENDGNYKNEYRKIKEMVKYPERGLDMSEYIIANQEDLGKDKVKYNLKALVSHIGETNFGHYISGAINYLNGKWYWYNDDASFSVDKYSVVNRNAYILFYQKEDPR